MESNVVAENSMRGICHWCDDSERMWRLCLGYGDVLNGMVLAGFLLIRVVVRTAWSTAIAWLSVLVAFLPWVPKEPFSAAIFEVSYILIVWVCNSLRIVSRPMSLTLRRWTGRYYRVRYVLSRIPKTHSRRSRIA